MFKSSTCEAESLLKSSKSVKTLAFRPPKTDLKGNRKLM